jgi:hypothetical protein
MLIGVDGPLRLLRGCHTETELHFTTPDEEQVQSGVNLTHVLHLQA